ncbi:hypothetical protein [Planktothrix sp. FACHB-1355]|uniref:hypothetical protein n=1 Tax=Planktothrix sp. FACHB-1355 TaxID=2692854 RepID=UPI0018EFE730|nr:hypothetical protein [Planktothrix sp. FACHB-1355]
MKNISIKLGLTLCLVLGFSQIAQAQSNPNSNQPAILTISPQESSGLSGAARTVEVWSGRGTAIDFTRVNERIIQVFLADPSRFTYTTDTPLDKGNATTLFLRQITPLRFPNLTTARVTNLFVKTQSPDGTMRLYTFNLQAGGNARQRYNGLSIATTSPTRYRRTSRLQASSSRSVRIDDIERGLQVAIARRYTSSNDPVVLKVRDFLATARSNSNRSLTELAQRVNLRPELLPQLATLGREKSNSPTTSSRRNAPNLLRFNR